MPIEPQNLRPDEWAMLDRCGKTAAAEYIKLANFYLKYLEGKNDLFCEDIAEQYLRAVSRDAALLPSCKALCVGGVGCLPASEKGWSFAHTAVGVSTKGHRWPLFVLDAITMGRFFLYDGSQSNTQGGYKRVRATRYSSRVETVEPTLNRWVATAWRDAAATNYIHTVNSQFCRERQVGGWLPIPDFFRRHESTSAPDALGW